MSLTLLPVLSLTLFQASAPTLALWPSSVFTFMAVTSHTCTQRGSCLNDDNNCRQISSYLMTDLNKSPVLCVPAATLFLPSAKITEVNMLFSLVRSQRERVTCDVGNIKL